MCDNSYNPGYRHSCMEFSQKCYGLKISITIPGSYSKKLQWIFFLNDKYIKH